MAVEPNSLRTSHLRLSSSPRHRFVHFTDIHYRGDAAFLHEVVTTVNALKPDFACFTGDLVEESQFASEALSILEKITAPLYGIPGNHDYWAHLDFDLPRESFAKGGGKWLMDEQTLICSDQICLHGLSGVHHTPFQPRPGMKNILLSHYPAAVDRYPETRFDLVLAGHSHGGQVRLPLFGAIVVPFGVGEYQLGLYETAAGPLYVNAGLGYFYANVRFFCRPELTVIEI